MALSSFVEDDAAAALADEAVQAYGDVLLGFYWEGDFVADDDLASGDGEGGFAADGDGC